VDEDVWRLANPRAAVATFASTAQSCSYLDGNGGKFFYSTDDSAGTFGSASAVYLISDLPAGFAPQYATVEMVTAIIAKGNLLALVTLRLGSQSSPSDESDFVQNVLPIAVGKLKS